MQEWIHFKLTDESWQTWRDENPEKVAAMKVADEIKTCKED